MSGDHNHNLLFWINDERNNALILNDMFNASSDTSGSVILNFEDSKFLFEKDIVFNPKNEISYLYLAKIFEEKEDEVYEELNLNTVLLLNPKNEEAIYMLMQLKIKQSNFSATKELLKKFNLVCVSICSKNQKIEKKLESLSP